MKSFLIKGLILLTLLPTNSSASWEQRTGSQLDSAATATRAGAPLVAGREYTSRRSARNPHQGYVQPPRRRKVNAGSGAAAVATPQLASRATPARSPHAFCNVTCAPEHAAHQQPQLLFLHMQKCGGTTVEGSLRRMAEAARLQYARMTISQVKRVRAPHDKRHRVPVHADIVAGHIFHGLHRYTNPPAPPARAASPRPRPSVYFTMLRHPVARVISHYSDNGAKCSSLSSKKDINEDIRAFAERCAGVDYYYNRLVERAELAPAPGKSGRGGSGGERLGEVKRALDRSFAAVGLVEHFDDSMVLFGHALKRWLPGPFTYCREQRKHSTPKVDAATWKWLEDKLWVDMEIYRHALRLIRQRKLCCFQDKFDSELAAFRTRQEVHAKSMCTKSTA